MPNVVSDMAFRELAVPGAWEITPQLHSDGRGAFFEWFTEPTFQAMTGHAFEMRQANCSTSAAGALRGLHFAQLPPGQAKYITCVRGSVFDVVVDIRVGSPSFGQWDSVLLDGSTRRSVYLSEGLAHGFLALEEDSTVMYLCSTPYAPKREHTICPNDPAIGIDWPLPPTQQLLSARDADAPTLEEVRAAGLLPDWGQAKAFETARRQA